MRELKFRAWDGKKMQYDVFPTSNNTVGRWVKTGGGIELRFCDSGGTKVDVMQSTGRKDKNRIEIYEDSIVRKHHKNYRIAWNGFWELQRHNDWHLALHKIESKKLEVIGNVHQNPRLLENP